MSIASFDFSKSVFINLSVSVWSARATITRDDLDPAIVAQLPPEVLSTLGSRRLVDKDTLSPINSGKAAAFRLLNSRGTRFMGGWVVAEDRLDSILLELDTIGVEFRDNVTEFLNHYSDYVSDWCSQFPEWEQLIRSACPSTQELGTKFKFAFQAVRVSPAQVTYDAQCNDTEQSITSMGDTMLAEVLEALANIRRNTFPDGRTKATARTFNALTPVIDKLDNLAPLSTSAAHLAVFLRDVQQTYAARAASGDTNAVMGIAAILDAVLAPHGIDRLCHTAESYDAGMSPLEASIDVLLAGTPQQPAPQPMPQPVASTGTQPMPQPVANTGTQPMPQPVANIGTQPAQSQQPADAGVIDLMNMFL